jgi:hypothetical protein
MGGKVGNNPIVSKIDKAPSITATSWHHAALVTSLNRPRKKGYRCEAKNHQTYDEYGSQD